MCRLMGIAGAADDVRRFALTGAENSLQVQGIRNMHGTGLAGFVGGELQIDKTVKGAMESDLLHTSQLIGDTPTLLGHVRWRTVGPTVHENSHPYASADRTMAMAHNGEISNLDLLRLELGDEVVDQIRSTNDSGLWTALVTREVGDKGVKDGLRQAVRWMDANANDSISGNLLLVKADGTLAGVRTHEINPLGIAPTGIAGARLGARLAGDAPGWVVSSEAVSKDQPWRGLAVREAFEIDPQLNLRTWRIDEP